MRRGFFAVVLACLLSAAFSPFADAQTAPPPEKIAELVKLMSDPEVKTWIENQRAQLPAAKTEAASVDLHAVGLDLRSRFRSLISAFPRAPAAIAAVIGGVLAEARERGLPPPGLIIAGIVVIALLGEWQSRRLFRSAASSAAPVVSQAVRQIGPVLVFALVAAAVFFAFDWPPAFDTVIVHYLAAAVIFRVVIALHAMALAAGSLTRHRFRRIVAFSAVFIFGLATIGVARAFTVDHDIQRVLAVFVMRNHLHGNMPSKRILLELAKHGPAKHIRQRDIERYGGWQILLSEIERICAAHRDDPLEPAVASQAQKDPRIMRIIFDDEQYGIAGLDLRAIVGNLLKRLLELSGLQHRGCCWLRNDIVLP